MTAGKPLTWLLLITMLWKMAGKPKAEKKFLRKFKDVDATVSGHLQLHGRKKRNHRRIFGWNFQTPKSVTRKETLLMLYRFAGKPKATGKLKFKDVSARKNSDTYKALLWGTNNKNTKGTTNTLFSPDAVCKRAQIVTFLYRYDQLSK